MELLGLVIIAAFVYPAIGPLYMMWTLLEDVVEQPFVDLNEAATQWVLDGIYIIAVSIVIGVGYFGMAGPTTTTDKVVAIALGIILALIAIADAIRQLFLVNKQPAPMPRKTAAIHFAIYILALAAYAAIILDPLTLVQQ